MEVVEKVVEVVEKVVAPVVGVAFDGTGETVKWRRAFEQYAQSDAQGVKSVISLSCAETRPERGREAKRGCLFATSRAGTERVVGRAKIAGLIRTVSQVPRRGGIR